MASDTYELFVEAMKARRPIACDFDDIPRQICPIILGHTDGREVALVYQFAGATSKGPLRAPSWRCLELDRITNARVLDGAWRSGGSHSADQSCVKAVDYDVNPNSPYNPKYRL